MKKYSKRQIALIINLVTIIFEIIAFAIRPNRYDIPSIAFYTVLSNYIALGSSILFAIMYFLKKEDNTILTTWRYTASVTLTVTFLIVIFVLVWYVDPVELLFDRNNVFHHILCPIITIVSYIFFEKHNNNPKVIIPNYAFSIVYCVVCVWLNIEGKLNGPYPFFMTQVFGVKRVVILCYMIAICMLPICLGFCYITQKVEKETTN